MLVPTGPQVYTSNALRDNALHQMRTQIPYPHWPRTWIPAGPQCRCLFSIYEYVCINVYNLAQNINPNYS
jgi:hypothetical protein